MSVRSLPQTIGLTHGLTVNSYGGVPRYTAYIDIANFKEAMFTFNVLSVSATDALIALEHSDDASTWTELGSVDIVVGVYAATIPMLVHESDVKRYVRARIEPGAGGNIVCGCDILSFLPRAENPQPLTFVFDSANL